MWLLLAMMLDWADFATEPFEKQRPYLLDCVDPKVKYATTFCGLQAGKTIAECDGAYAALYGPNPLMLPPQMRNRFHAEVWAISRSYALVDVVVNTLKARTPEGLFLSDAECRKLGLKRGNQRTWWLRPRDGGCEDQFPICLRARSASDPDELRATNTLVLVLADEFAHWKHLAWQNLQGRAIVVDTKYLGATTPRGKNYAYKDLWVPSRSGRTPSIRCHSWKSDDNPYANKDVLAELRKKFGPNYAAQELDGLFVTNIGYVYDFDRDRHVEQLPSAEPAYYPIRIMGVDPGYGDPYAVAVLLRDPDGRWWVAEEYYETKRITDDVIPWCRQMAKRWEVTDLFVDKRRPTDWQMLRRAGMPAKPNVDVFGEDDRRTIMPMVRIVQRLFREDKIRVTPKCEWTMEEFESYVFPDREDNEKNVGENPVDYKNHLMDATRYGIASIESLPEDRRPRIRTGNDLLPRASPLAKPGPIKMVSAQEHFNAVFQKQMKERQMAQGRRQDWRAKPWAGPWG